MGAQAADPISNVQDPSNTWVTQTPRQVALTKDVISGRAMPHAALLRFCNT